MEAKSVETHPILKLYQEILKLKQLCRQGWLNRKVEPQNCEKVAEHSFGVAILSYLVAEEYKKEVDSGKAMLLGLFHELGEIYAGDITPKDNVSDEDKFNQEYSAVRKLLTDFPNSQKYLNYWLEYAQQETPEAKLVKEIDTLEALIQAGAYAQKGYNDMEEFLPDAKSKIKSTEIKEILNNFSRNWISVEK